MIRLRRADSHPLTARQCTGPPGFAKCLLQSLSRHACLEFIVLQPYATLPFPYLSQRVSTTWLQLPNHSMG